MPRRPSELSELRFLPHLHAIGALDGRHEPLSNDYRIRALKRLGHVFDLNQIDSRKAEPHLRTILRVDQTMLAADRAMITIAMLEDVLDENMLRDTLKLAEKLKHSVPTIICNLMIRGIQPLSFRERVMAQFLFEGRDEPNPEEVQE